MCGKNLQRGKNGLGNLASGASRRVLAAGDAGGEEIITRGCGHAPNKPAECRDILVRVADGSGLATEDRLTGSRERHDVEHRVHGLVGEGQLASVKAAQKFHLLVGRNGQRTLEPKLGHAARQVVVAVTDFRYDLLVAFQTDARSQSLKIPNAGEGKGAAQGLVVVPRLDRIVSAIPRQAEIRAAGYTGLESDQRVEHLEGRARCRADAALFRVVTQPSLMRIIVEHECAGVRTKLSREVAFLGRLRGERATKHQY